MLTTVPAHGSGAFRVPILHNVACFPRPAPRCLHTAVRASKSDDHEELVLTEDDTRLLNCMYTAVEPQRVGAEYGEVGWVSVEYLVTMRTCPPQGFVQLRVSGESLHLDVDTLNERLQLNGAARMRTAMKPDEAFGMIFSWCVWYARCLISRCHHAIQTVNRDGVIVDTRTLQRRAWQQLAAERGLPFPTMDRPLYDIRPERVVTDVLQWSRDWSTTQALTTRFAQLFAADFRRLDAPLPGVQPWLTALQKANVPCAVITTLSKADMRACLQRMGLQRFFHAEVTAEDGMDTLAQRYLSAAIKLARPPRSCVVFDATPGGITAAHNCTMKAVAVRSVHKGHHLKAADLTCAAMSELSVYNVRRLFSNQGSEFMDYAKLTHHQATHGAAPHRLLRNATLEREPEADSDEPPNMIRC